MINKRAIRKALLMLCLACLLFFNLYTVPAHAIAGVDDLIIVGGTVMTMALVGTLGMMSISGAGMGEALQQAAINASVGAKQFGQDLFASYARSQNITAGQAVQIAAQGTSYLEDGKIIFDEQMSKMMDGFINWAWSEDGGNLISYASPSSSGGGLVDWSDLDRSVMVNPDFNYVVYSASSFSYQSIYHNSTTTRSWTADPGVKFAVYYDGSSKYIHVGAYAVVSGLYCYDQSGASHPLSYAINRNGVTYYYYGIKSNYLGTLQSCSLPSTVIPGDTLAIWDIPYIIFGGNVATDPEYDVNLDVLGNVGSDTVGVLDPDQFLSIPDAPVGGGTIDIDDWLDAIGDAIAEGVASIPVAIDDATVIDVAAEAAAEDALPIDITAEQTGAVDVADSTSIESLDEFTLDLTDFFPFCIPFDIYDMLSLFSATREAPHFDWRFYVPGVCDETITIDFSAFDSAAQVLRSVELIAAAIGLALITKKLIQGGD